MHQQCRESGSQDYPQCNQSLQQTYYYPYDQSTANEDGQVLDSSSRHGKALTRLNSAFCR